MSLLSTNCHYYEGTISGWGAGITKAWAFAWFKSSDGSTERGFVQVSNATLDGSQDHFGIYMDGGNEMVAVASTANVDATTPTTNDLFFWQAAQLDKWTVACGVFDATQTTADIKLIYGRVAADAIPAATNTNASDLVATQQALTKIYVGRIRQLVTSGSGTDSATSGTKLAYIAIGQGDVPTQTNIQSCLDGMHPADLPGVWEYWDLTSSGSGLTGALQSITLTPTGGSAAATWDGADNPTVSAPSGGGGGSAIGAAAHYYRQMQ